MMKKVRVNLHTTEIVREKLQEQAEELGMSMGGYLAHLVMQKEQQKQSISLMKDMNKTVKEIGLTPEMLNQLIKSETD